MDVLFDSTSGVPRSFSGTLAEYVCGHRFVFGDDARRGDIVLQRGAEAVWADVMDEASDGLPEGRVGVCWAHRNAFVFAQAPPRAMREALRTRRGEAEAEAEAEAGGRSARKRARRKDHDYYFVRQDGWARCSRLMCVTVYLEDGGAHVEEFVPRFSRERRAVVVEGERWTTRANLFNPAERKAWLASHDEASALAALQAVRALRAGAEFAGGMQPVLTAPGFRFAPACDFVGRRTSSVVPEAGGVVWGAMLEVEDIESAEEAFLDVSPFVEGEPARGATEEDEAFATRWLLAGRPIEGLANPASDVLGSCGFASPCGVAGSLALLRDMAGAGHRAGVAQRAMAERLAGLGWFSVHDVQRALLCPWGPLRTTIVPNAFSVVNDPAALQYEYQDFSMDIYPGRVSPPAEAAADVVPEIAGASA